MAVTYAVIGPSERDVATALQQLVDILGLEWATLPQQMPGQPKWVGRATTPDPQAAAALPAVS